MPLHEKLEELQKAFENNNVDFNNDKKIEIEQQTEECKDIWEDILKPCNKQQPLTASQLKILRDCKNKLGFNLLDMAIENDWDEASRFLIKQTRTNLLSTNNQDQISALHRAVTKENVEITKVIINTIVEEKEHDIFEVVQFSVEIFSSGFFMITLPFQKFRLGQRILNQYF